MSVGNVKHFLGLYFRPLLIYDIDSNTVFWTVHTDFIWAL